jgi:hypothetical protein
MLMVGKDIAITSDGLNVIVNKVGVNKNKQQTLRAIGYFGTIKNALDWLVEHEIKGTGFKDLETVVAKQDELYRLISGLDFTGAKPKGANL